MKFENPFKLQNWKFKKFLIVILFFQIFLLGLFALNTLGMDTSIIRPLIGFIYLSFIPGYLLLRILRLHKLSSIESFLYALGLSLFMDMLVGFLMNIFYPILGITNKPIAEIPIVLTMTGVVFLLCIITYLRDKNYNNPDFIDLKDILNPQVLFLSLIPFMAIFGTYLVNYYHNNILLMIMIVVIALVALIVGFTDWINKKYYPYVIWVMAIALIFHASLFTNYIHIQDVWMEYIVAKGIIDANFWNFQITGCYNSVLSDTILPSFIFYICKFSLNWIYKIVFPTYLSIIPIGLYYLYNHANFKINKKMSFLATFIFISIYPYYNTILFLTKQLIAELYMLLIFFVFLTDLNENRKKFPLIVFFTSIIISHYGTSLLLLSMMIISTIFLITYAKLLDKNNLKYYIKNLPYFLLFYIIFWLGWYIFISGSSTFESVVILINNIVQATLTEFFNTDLSRGVYTLKRVLPLSGIFMKYSIMLISIFIIIGYIYESVAKFKSLPKNIFYIVFSTFWIGIIGATILIPNFAVMNPLRLYHLALFILSPFYVIGGIIFFKVLINILNKINIIKLNLTSITLKILKILYIISICSLLLNTQFIFEILDANPLPAPLSYNSINKNSDMTIRGLAGSKYVSTYDVYGARWLSKYGSPDKKIYVPNGQGLTLVPLYTYSNLKNPYIYLSPNMSNIKHYSYIFIYYFNLAYHITYDSNKALGVLKYYELNDTNFNNLQYTYNKLYSNKNCYIMSNI